MARVIKLLCISGLAIYLLTWSIFFVIFLQTNFLTFETLDAEQIHSAVVFGGLYTPGHELSELNMERLDAAYSLYKNGFVEEIIVSNTGAASIAMRDYLLQKQVDEEDITLDTDAQITEDSCRFLKAGNATEGVVLVSQRFHLPRAAYLCRKYGIDAKVYAAENIRAKEQASYSLETLMIRAWRYQRESLLLSLSLLGIYK